MALINSLCVMLQTTPFHRENYSRLILGVIIQFYQRCSDWFQSLVSTPGAEGEAPRVALAAQWAQRNEMSTCLTELQSTAVCEGSGLDATKADVVLYRTTSPRNSSNSAASKSTSNSSGATRRSRRRT